MAVGTISLAGGGKSYSIKHFRIPSDATSVATIQAEQMTAQGVDGMRVRHLRKFYESFPALLHISASNPGNAVAIRTEIEKWRGRWVNLSLTWGGSLSRSWNNCFVEQLDFRVVASNTIASDISTETHTVMVRAILKPTEDVRGGGVVL